VPLIDNGTLSESGAFVSLVTLTSPGSPGVRLLTLNDPDRRNALSPAFKAALGEAVAEVAADAQARVLVVTGNGKAFSAGADLPALFGDIPGQPIHQVRAGLFDTYQSFLALRALTIPTIAAVNGASIGAGLNLAMCCDLRIANRFATFGATFSQIGLHPGGGCTYFLTSALGAQQALSLLLEGQAINAETALKMGIILSIEDDVVATALAMAERYALLDPELAADIKHAVAIANTQGFEATLDFEVWAQAAAAQKPQLQEIVDRFRK
jgi:enoyl-CoA hydratase